MHLGEMLHRLADDCSAADALTALGDIVLFTRVASAAEGFDETPGAYVATSVGRFAATADDAAWSSLIANMERAGDPAGAALAYMLGWALESDAAQTIPPAGHTCNHGARCASET